ncbi:Lin0512 family protein [Candidatus Puniceispirillum sp.]|nr:Lin0512 family protein [Candidatus Puniceispirillum sp.]
MAKKRMVMELGMGSSLRQQDYTRAACRALEDALWHNSLSIADAFGLDRSAMIIEVDVAVQHPEKVDTSMVARILPYGQASVRAVYGGLDVPKPDGGITVIANVAVVVYLDIEPAEAAS